MTRQKMGKISALAAVLVLITALVMAGLLGILNVHASPGVTMTVLSRNGNAPVVGARVHIQTWTTVLVVGYTDSNGQFKVDPWTYGDGTFYAGYTKEDLTKWPRLYISQPFTITGGSASLTVYLTEIGPFYVKQRKTGEPGVTGVGVSLYRGGPQSGNIFATGTTDSNGKAVFDPLTGKDKFWLPDDLYFFSCWLSPTAGTSTSWTVGAGMTNFGPFKIYLTQFKITVKYSGGGPISGVTVEQWQGWTTIVTSATTSSSGEAYFWLPDGTWWFRVKSGVLYFDSWRTGFLTIGPGSTIASYTVTLGATFTTP